MNKIRKDKQIVQECKEKGLFIGNYIKNGEKKENKVNATQDNIDTFNNTQDSHYHNTESVEHDKKLINAITA